MPEIVKYENTEYITYYDETSEDMLMDEIIPLDTKRPALNGIIFDSEPGTYFTVQKENFSKIERTEREIFYFKDIGNEFYVEIDKLIAYIKNEYMNLTKNFISMIEFYSEYSLELKIIDSYLYR